MGARTGKGKRKWQIKPESNGQTQPGTRCGVFLASVKVAATAMPRAWAMSKLVRAETWIARHFEPGSEPEMADLEEWALTEHTGTIIGKTLFINDDALLPAPVQSANDGSLTANDLLTG